MEVFSYICLLCVFVGISQSPSVKGEHAPKVIIAAFLARIMHGKELGK